MRNKILALLYMILMLGWSTIVLAQPAPKINTYIGEKGKIVSVEGKSIAKEDIANISTIQTAGGKVFKVRCSSDGRCVDVGSNMKLSLKLLVAQDGVGACCPQDSCNTEFACLGTDGQPNCCPSVPVD